MLHWLKRQTLAFYVACALTVPLTAWLLHAWWLVFSGATDLELAIVPVVILGLPLTLAIGVGLIWLISGIYRKNHSALTVSILVFPIVWRIEASVAGPHHGVMRDVVAVFSLVIAVLIAWIYLKEPKYQ